MSKQKQYFGLFIFGALFFLNFIGVWNQGKFQIKNLNAAAATPCDCIPTTKPGLYGTWKQVFYIDEGQAPPKLDIRCPYFAEYGAGDGYRDNFYPWADPIVQANFPGIFVCDPSRGDACLVSTCPNYGLGFGGDRYVNNDPNHYCFMIVSQRYCAPAPTITPTETPGPPCQSISCDGQVNGLDPCQTCTALATPVVEQTPTDIQTGEPTPTEIQTGEPTPTAIQSSEPTPTTALTNTILPTPAGTPTPMPTITPPAPTPLPTHTPSNDVLCGHTAVQ
jgi:hypothetical protein